jgi:hypothetical protein
MNKEQRLHRGIKLLKVTGLIFLIGWLITIIALSPLIGVEVLQGWAFIIFMFSGFFAVFGVLIAHTWLGFYLDLLKIQGYYEENKKKIDSLFILGITFFLVGLAGSILSSIFVVGWLVVLMPLFWAAMLFGLMDIVECWREDLHKNLKEE